MPSTTSSSFSRPEPSSTVITPSLPTLSMALAISSPMSVSELAEIEPTWAISLLVEQGLEIFFSSSTAEVTALSMPRLRSIGFMPAATAFMPSRIRAWASTVAVVVPSPALSEVLEATSLTICAPMFSNLSASSISLATDTPSLVIVGAPKLFSSTTLRPFGPRVALTALASTFTPRTMRARASSPKRISLAAIAELPQFCDCGLGCGEAAGSAQHGEDVVFLHHQVLGAVELDLGAGVLAEQHLVADLDLRRAHVAVVEHLALAHGDDLALDRLLGGRIRDHDTTGGDLLFLGALDDDAVVQRLDVNRRAYLPRGATHRLYRAPPRPCARAKIRRLIASGNHPCRGCQAVLY
uniref:Uncharacterized protein n=1 Tax=Escherichia coli TaxID=562 RepID=A0A890DI01_ECOLX|nr:hypothetical protein [Escherichia coli]